MTPQMAPGGVFRRTQMAGNSSRRGAVRKKGKGPTVGSGGKGRRRLEGKGPTPKARDRKQKVLTKTAPPKPQKRSVKSQKAASDVVVGRNPVVEALKAQVPSTGLLIALGIERDERITEAIRLAKNLGIEISEVSKNQIDRIADTALHQGIALIAKPYIYSPLDTLLGSSKTLIALDGITDPRNLGAIIRSAAAFNAGGLLIGERRSAPVTAVVWRTSAGAAARLPVARVTNLTSTLRDAQAAGYFVVGLSADASRDIVDVANHFSDVPVVLVIGSEGKGISRLVAQTCDEMASIAITSDTESLNASVAAAIGLFAINSVLTTE